MLNELLLFFVIITEQHIDSPVLLTHVLQKTLIIVIFIIFGIDRMIEALNSDPKARPRELIEEVSAAVDEFVGSAPQFDDMTMLSITYKP